MSDLSDALFGQYQKDLDAGLYDHIRRRDNLGIDDLIDDLNDPLYGGQYDYMRGDYDPSYVSTGSNYKASSSGPSSSSMPGSGPSSTKYKTHTYATAPAASSPSSPPRPPRNRNHAMLIAMAGLAPIAGLAIGGMIGNKSQEETKAQQLAQMKYM